VGPSGRDSQVGCGKVVACTSNAALLPLGKTAIGMRFGRGDQGMQFLLKTQKVATDSKPRDDAAAIACSGLCSCQVLLSTA
jgi:hypothetical protein